MVAARTVVGKLNVPDKHSIVSKRTVELEIVIRIKCEAHIEVSTSAILCSRALSIQYHYPRRPEAAPRYANSFKILEAPSC